jgi:hypothetical protein
MPINPVQFAHGVCDEFLPHNTNPGSTELFGNPIP